jgi:hypothetical protein
LSPEFNEAMNLSWLAGTGQIGVGVAENAAFLLHREEGQDARTGLTA